MTNIVFLNPLLIQNLKRKKWGDMAYDVPPGWKSGGIRPPCPPPNCAHNTLATHFWYNPASFKLLQKKELDIFAVIELIDSVLDIPQQNRSNCENVFHKIFDQAKNECEKYDAPLLIPRTCKSQIFRDNYPADDPEHCFRWRVDSLIRSRSGEVFGAWYPSIAMLRQTLLKI